MDELTARMHELFEMINFDLFDDMLDKPGFFVYDEKLMKKMGKHIFNDKSAFHGICIPTEKTYLIGIADCLTPLEFFDTLVHELIHVYLYKTLNGYNGGHGKDFKDMCQNAFEFYYT